MSALHSVKVLGRWNFLLDRWRIIALVILVAVLYTTVVVGLVGDWWKDADYSHGFFVPVLSGYLIYRSRRELVSLPKKPSSWGLIVLLGALGLLFLGSLGAEFFLARLSLIGVIVGLVLCFWGWSHLRQMAFPLSFLLLMIPLPMVVYNEIVFPMQLITSRLATAALQNLDLFPVLREGNLLITARCTVEVVQACSGVRSLVSLLALASGYGYLAERSLVVRCLLAISVLPLAVLGNALRVCAQVFLAQYFGLTAIEGTRHLLLGLVGFFAAAGLVPIIHHMTIVARRYWETQRKVSVAVRV